MNLGPSILGALIGAAVGVAAQVGLESWLGREAIWFALVIGVLTGFGARAMAGAAMARANYLRAGLTALVALGAIVGGGYASSEFTRQRSVAEYESAPKFDTKREAAPPTEDDAGAEDDADDADQPEPADGSQDAADSSQDAADGEQDPADADNSDQGDTPAADNADSGEGDDADGDDPADADGASAGDDAQIDAADETDFQPADPPAVQTLDIRSMDVELPEGQQGDLPMSPWQFAFFGLGTFLAYELARGGGHEHPPAETEAT